MVTRSIPPAGGATTGLPRATTVAAATARLAAVTTTRAIRADTPSQVTTAASQVTTAASPGTTSAGRATTRVASVGRRPESGCGLALAPAASARGADGTQVLRSLRGRATDWTFGLTRGGVGSSQLMGRLGRLPRGRRQVRRLALQPSSAGRHSGDDPAIFLGRSEKRSVVCAGLRGSVNLAGLRRNRRNWNSATLRNFG